VSAVVQAVAEVGVDLAKKFPKPLTDDGVRAADVVITMGGGDACPMYPGKRHMNWDLPDPAGKPLERSDRSGTKSSAACGAPCEARPCWPLNPGSYSGRVAGTMTLLSSLP
jgi:protein-tyrosine-phosphatase